MRYKFRAFDTETKEMSHDYLSKNWLRVCIESPFVELMQWTGLMDKNGVDIYEGDIVSWRVDTGWRYVTPVEWRDNLCRFICRTAEDKDRWVMLTGSEEYEVVGNIYKHPSLLGRQAIDSTE